MNQKMPAVQILKIQSYTIRNDMSSRDIEGEDPLYLPQAKIYERSTAIGPCLYIPEQILSPETFIKIIIKRNATEIFKNDIGIKNIKRSFNELVEYLFRECEFKNGVFSSQEPESFLHTILLCW